MARPRNVGSMSEVFARVMDGVRAARQLLHDKAEFLLDQQISLGNSVYAVQVDGKSGSGGRDAIFTAQRRVKIMFAKGAIQLAVDVLDDMLKTAIKKKVSTDTSTGKMAASVRMFYVRPSNPRSPNGPAIATEITNASEVENFGPGESVWLYPTVPYQAFSNSLAREKTGDGFLATAARAIRRKLRLGGQVSGKALASGNFRQQRGAGLKIYVGRSNAIKELIHQPANTTGRIRKRPGVNQPIPKYTGAPAIVIRMTGKAQVRGY